MIEIRSKLLSYHLAGLILLFVIVLFVFIASLSLPTLVQDTIRRNAEHRAERWVEGLIAQVPNFRQLAETGDASANQNAIMDAMISGTDIFRFKIFSPLGEHVFTSDKARFRQSDGDNHSATAIRVLAEMVNDISVKSGRSEASRPDTFVEAYLPVISSSNEVLGVIEVYVDVSWLASNMKSRFKELGAFLFLFCSAVFLLLAQLLVRRTKQIESVRSRETWLAAILYHAPFEVVIKDTEGRFKALSRNVVEEFDGDLTDALGKTTADYFPEEIAKVYMDADREVVRTGTAVQTELAEDFGDRFRYSLNSKFPLVNEDGEITGVCSITNDITESKKSEAKLAQAQKMEAIGQLTGGIAHDFNNLLAIMMWSAEELQIKLGPSDNSADIIIETAKKGAFLTQQLLSFSRKQNLTPQSVDVEKLVLKLSLMLARTLGETIQLTTSFSADLTNATVDPNQLENAILNLALNARDAMPNGGILTIDCSLVAKSDIPGIDLAEKQVDAYVLMSVSDSGVGMSAEVMNHVFEPFYTTKEVGSGSGLGLSMVYGFAQQSSGHVSVESNLGIGTTISLYLPCASLQSTHHNKIMKIESPLTQKLHILLLEDDLKLLHLIQKRLEAMGHSVLGCSCASDARKVLSSEKKFDLLLADVVLPGGVSGLEFASEMRDLDKDIRVLFMSGYPQSNIESTSFPTEGLVVLRKPFASNLLAAALADVMN